MSMYMGKGETSTAITEALEVLRKYPHQWITYNPNDPLANSVVTYLKKQGKVTVNRFHQFRAVPKYRTNPSRKKLNNARKGAPGTPERSAKLHKIRKLFVKDMNVARRNGNRVREDYMIHKLIKLDRMIYAPRNINRRK